MERDNFVKIIKEMIDKSISEKNLGLSIWQVTDIKGRKPDGSITDYRVNIKHLNFKYTLDNVPIVGIGLGHKRGMLKYPNVGDFVIVGYIDKQPFVLGTVYDYFSQKPDNIPIIKLDEFCIVQKEKGSIILMKDNNDILIRASDSEGNFDNGARLRINSNGEFKLFNKNNFGIVCDKDGNITIYGNSINNLKVVGKTEVGGSPGHTHDVDIDVSLNNTNQGTWQ